jgi:hypothetical protein
VALFDVEAVDARGERCRPVRRAWFTTEGPSVMARRLLWREDRRDQQHHLI